MYNFILIYALGPKFPTPLPPSISSVSILSETPPPLTSISSVRFLAQTPHPPKRADQIFEHSLTVMWILCSWTCPFSCIYLLKFSLILGHLVMQKGLYIDKIDDEKYKFVPCFEIFFQFNRKFLISNCSYSVNI